MTLPVEISSVTERIRGQSAAQRISFRADTWHKWLRSVGWPEDRVENLLGRVTVQGGRSGVVARSDMRALATEARDSDQALVDLLVMALIWGRGKSNGRMKHHILGLLRMDGLEKKLQEIRRESCEGTPEQAYKAWTLPGLRAPFFTKVLWACTSDLEDSQKCLVLDGSVKKSLKALECWQAGLNPAIRYGEYVGLLRQWSTDDLSVEDLEWALYRANGNLRSLEKVDVLTRD